MLDEAVSLDIKSKDMQYHLISDSTTYLLI
jgi:hypothetical protein